MGGSSFCMPGGENLDIIEVRLPEDFETVEIYPLSDLHIGDPRVDKRLFREFLNHIMAEPNRFIIYNGDNMNNAIKSSVSNVYNEEMNPREQKKWLQYELKPVKDRILVFVEGNHEGRTTKDVDQRVVEDIADYLDKGELYRENEAYIKLCFGKRRNSESQMCYTIYVTHGSGGGKRPGSAMNNIELVALGTEADIYIMGHVHKKMAYKNAVRRPDLRNNNILEQERLFVVSSHWSEFGGYAARKMYNPSAKGSVPIKLYDGVKKMEAVI